MTQAEKIAWAAGLFEGEGCFTLTTSERRVPRAVLSMTDEETVRRFAAIIGVGKVTPRNPPSRLAHWKPQWMWYAECADVAVVLCLLRPFLSTRRLERGEQVVARYEHWIAESTRARTCLQCGKTFRPKYSTQSNRQKFCKTRCRWNYANAKRKRLSLGEEAV